MGEARGRSYTPHKHHPLGWIFLQGKMWFFYFFRKHCLHKVLNLHQLPNGAYRCYKDTPTCLHTMYAENQTKWLPMNIEYQAEPTIVNTSQTKHLIPCFQYEFDIQQYSTTPGGQCWGSDPQWRGIWKDWYYHDVGHETSIATVKKYKRVQIVLCQDVQQFGWATCQRLSPNPDTLFYKFSNDVPVHRLFLDLRCDERSTLTHPVPSVWHASSRYTDSTNLPYPRLYISSHISSNPHRSSPQGIMVCWAASR